MTSQLTVNTPYTGPIAFVNSSGATVTGPVGVITASDASVTVSLSASGQFYNVEMMSSLASPVTLTWTDPAGVVPSFTTTVTDQEVSPFEGVTGSFGTLAPGTTA